MIVPAGDAARDLRVAGAGHAGRGRRPGLPRRGVRRLHRRPLGGDAARCRRRRRHRRPFGAADGPRRDRRGGERQGARARGGPVSSRSSASAKPRTNATTAKTLDVVQAQTQTSLPDGATAANLVVAYEPVWAIGTGLTPTPADVAAVHGFIRRNLETRYGAAGAADPDSVRRVGQAVERSRADARAQCRWRAGRRRQPQGRRFPRHCAGVSIAARPNRPCRRRRQRCDRACCSAIDASAIRMVVLRCRPFSATNRNVRVGIKAVSELGSAYLKNNQKH